jgi:hypothetical protein
LRIAGRIVRLAKTRRRITFVLADTLCKK